MILCELAKVFFFGSDQKWEQGKTLLDAFPNRISLCFTQYYCNSLARIFNSSLVLCSTLSSFCPDDDLKIQIENLAITSCYFLHSHLHSRTQFSALSRGACFHHFGNLTRRKGELRFCYHFQRSNSLKFLFFWSFTLKSYIS